MARAPSASISFSMALCLRCRSSMREASRIWSPLRLSRSFQACRVRRRWPCERDQFTEVAGQSFGAPAQFGHDGAQQHCRAKRLQRIFGSYQQRRRRAPCRPVAAPPAPRQFRSAANQASCKSAARGRRAAAPRFGLADPGLDAAHLGCDVDQLLIELAAVLADRRDIGLQLLLQFGGAFLLRAGGFEFLLPLLDRVGRGRCGLRLRGDLGRRRGRLMPAKPADNSDRKRNTRPNPADRGGRCQGPMESPALLHRIRQAFAPLRLSAVIGVARQNGRGPINLFQKHDANHLMRPGRGAECNAQLCLAPQIGRKSVRPADHENSVGDRLIPPAAKMPGKSRAVDIVPAFIERHQDGFCRDCRRNRRGFLGYPGRGVPRAAFRNFMNLKAAETELAADIVEIAAR